ncbi:unnamed protein product [Ostreobium quekettii]|uniref:Uncharacterized protein n=1 Tax=Ostreobium quekettii TaxID=121088 RepID=A0A8S1J8K4_9CHLO|nr:unnamed protein product [Ostreobium quekettii]
MAAPEDVGRLKRLVREAFEELLAVKGRLRALERDGGDRGAGDDAPAGASQAWGRGRREKAERGLRVGQATVRGAVDIVGRASWVKGQEHDETHSVASRLRLSLLVPFAEGLGTLVTELTTMPPDSAVQLKKVLVRREWPSTGIKATLAARGGQAQDIVPTLNPHAEQGLSRVLSLGSSLHQSCEGEGFGLSWTKGGFMLSGARFWKTGHRDHPLTSSIAQVVVSPLRGLSLGAVAMRHASTTLCGRMGSSSPFSPHRVASRERMDSPAEFAHPGMSPRHTSGMSRIGATGALNVSDEVLVSGWVGVDVGRSMQFQRRLESWGLCASSYPYPHGITWRTGVGRSMEMGVPSTTVEASVQVDAGSGMHVFPGIVLRQRPDGWKPFLCMRSLWTF